MVSEELCLGCSRVISYISGEVLNVLRRREPDLKDITEYDCKRIEEHGDCCLHLQSCVRDLFYKGKLNKTFFV